MLALVAICLPLVLLLAAFAVDVTYLRIAKTELRLAADAAARSAGRFYAATHDERRATEAAKTAGELNFVAAKPLTLDDEDVEFGVSEYDESSQTWNFEPGAAPPNSVRVTARKTSDSPSGAVDLFFSQAFTNVSIEVTTQAIAVSVDPELMFVVDRSGTMAYPVELPSVLFTPPPSIPGWNWCDPAPASSRWMHVDRAIRLALDRLEREGSTWTGLATFADAGETDAPLAKNFDLARRGLDRRSLMFCGGDKQADEGLRQAAAELSGNSPSSGIADQHVVLLTDGKDLGSELFEVAGSLVPLGVQVHVVSYGPEADLALLEELTSVVGGSLVHVSTEALIDTALRDIESQLTSRPIVVPQ